MQPIFASLRQRYELFRKLANFRAANAEKHLTDLRHFSLMSLPICRNLILLSQQLRQESGYFLGISPKSPYLCIKFIHLIRVYI